MNCMFCEKHLHEGEASGFQCVCDECLWTLEKQETRFVEKICEQREELKNIYDLD